MPVIKPAFQFDDAYNTSTMFGPPPITLMGTAGDDWWIPTTNASETVFAGLGNDHVNAGGGNDTVYGEGGNDTIDGGVGNDFLYGGEGYDSLVGGQGNDRLYGGEGNDSLSGSEGADHLDGGSGIDSAGYSSSSAAVEIDLAANVARGGDAEGDTFVSIEALVGSWHNDILRGNGEANRLTGGLGDDILDGRAGQDELNGADGNDTLFSGADDDLLWGWFGNDRLEGGHGADILHGGNGIDTLSYSRSGAGVTANLATNAVSGGDAYLDVISGFENLVGSTFADTLTGAGDANVIEGLAGNDIMTGGADADTFVFAVKQGANGVSTAPGYDTITDFVVGVDHLQFSGVDSLWDLIFTQSGADTVITYAQADGAITLTGVDVNNLLQHHVTDLLL